MQYLKYAPVTSIIGWWFQEPDWLSVTFHGAPSSMYLTAWMGPYFGTDHLMVAIESGGQNDSTSEYLDELKQDAQQAPTGSVVVYDVSQP